MFKLSYKTRGSAEPTGKQRVFFTCHPDDFDRYFDEISDDILASQNCAIYYIGKEDEAEYDEELFMSYLPEMRLVVIPVTTNLLTHPSRALDVVYNFAQERHIPVLTFMQEDGLDALYSRVFGDLQYLDKHAKDDTAIPFEKKLTDYLSSVLVGDELAEKVRAAFDAYIFLSYRKKDRVYAQELMRLIHKNEFCRDIAIWYDEFLVPGEGFNGAIKAALEKSSLFALAVTPNLLEKDNYVMKEEYPMARDSGKPILPAEVVRTDRKELEAKYDGIPKCTDAHDAPRLTESLLTVLEGIAKRENDSDHEHNFMIGLAYLTGIDVEVDVDRALALITGAAEAGGIEAIKKLVDMYRSGDGVEIDYLRAIEWQKKIVALWEGIYNESGFDYVWSQCSIELQKLSGYWLELGRLHEAKECCEKNLEIYKTIAMRTGDANARVNVSVCYGDLGSIAKAEGRLDDAREYYEKACGIVAELAEEMKTVEVLRNLSISYDNLGNIAWLEGRLTDARGYCEKALEIRLKLAEKAKTTSSRRDLFLSYNNLGNIFKTEGLLTEAREYYEKSLLIAAAIAEETKTADSRRNLFITYDNLGDIAKEEERLDDAREYYEKSFEIAAALAEERKTVDSRRNLAISCSNLGEIAQAAGRIDDAREYYERAVDIFAALAAETKTADSRYDLSIGYVCLGEIAQADDRLDDARAYYEKAFEITAVLAEKTKTAASRRELSICCERLGCIAKSEERFDDARKYYEKALEIRLKLAEETKTAASRRDLAASCYMLGDIAEEEDRLDDAREYYERSAETLAAVAEETKTIESRRDLSLCYDRLCCIAETEERLADAREYCLRSLELRLKIAAETQTVQSYEDLAASYFNLGVMDYPKIDRDYLLMALEICKALVRTCPDVIEYKERCDFMEELLRQ